MVTSACVPYTASALNEFRLKAPVDPHYYGLSAMVDLFEIGEPTLPIKLTDGLLANGQF
jgi:hypothetical protein